MSLSTLQSNSGGVDVTPAVTSRAVALSSAVTVGSSILVIALSRFPITTVTDSKGNTYTRDAVKSASGANIAVWRCTVATGGSSFTVTATAGSLAGPIAVAVVEVSGALDFSGSAVSSGLNNAPKIVFDDSLGESYCIVAFDAGPVSGTIPTSPAGWTSRVKSVSAHLAQGMDRIFSSPQGSVTATWAINQGQSWVSLAALYAATPAAPPAPYAVADQPGPHWPFMPGSPWAYATMRGPLLDQPAPATVPVVHVPQLLIPPVPASDVDRQIRASQRASLVLNSLLRAGVVFRTGESTFVIRAGGKAAARNPGVADDKSQGFNVGTMFVNNTDPAVPRLWQCADNTVGAAVWVELQVVGISGVPSGGATGVFPG